MHQHEPSSNLVIDRMKSGSVALGIIVRVVRSGEIAMIAKATDHDFIFIDNQHALLDNQTIGQMALVAIGCGVTPLVRVRAFDDPDIPRLLDAGVMGIVVPDVNSASDAARAVAAAKFPPQGHRSIGGPSPLHCLRTVPAATQMRLLNESTLVICMIETARALSNLDSIAAVKGVDVLHVGCNDLLADIGKPGDFECPELTEAMSKVIAAGNAHGIHIGLGGDKNMERQKRWIEQGVRFVTTQSDIAMLTAEASRSTEELRKAISPGR